MIALGIDFGNLDYTISRNIVNSSSSIGDFIANYGEVPGWICCLLIFGMIFVKGIEVDYLTKILYITIIIASIIGLFLALPIIQYVSLLILLGFFFFFSRNFDLDEELLRKASYVMAWLIFTVSAVAISFIKLVWGRIRYRDLLGISEFTPWYWINGINGNYSFPSGHTGMGIMILPILYYIQEFHIHKIYRKLFSFLVISWPLFVAYGRVIIGAHYMTDVLFSLVLGINVFLYLDSKSSTT